jgi:hypothetical protein
MPSATSVKGWKQFIAVIAHASTVSCMIYWSYWCRMRVWNYWLIFHFCWFLMDRILQYIKFTPARYDMTSFRNEYIHTQGMSVCVKHIQENFEQFQAGNYVGWRLVYCGLGAFEFNSVAPPEDTHRCSLITVLCLHADNSEVKSNLNVRRWEIIDIVLKLNGQRCFYWYVEW